MIQREKKIIKINHFRMIHQSLTWYDHQQMIILPVILSSNYVDIQQHFQNRLCFQIPTKINRHIVANKKNQKKSEKMTPNLHVQNLYPIKPDQVYNREIQYVLPSFRPV